MTTSTAPEILFLGSRARVLAEGGALGLVDLLEVPAGDMPPLHVHRNEDEGFYVLEGRVSLYLPGREIELGQGDFALAPRGVPHTYRVADDRPARWLVTSSPAGFERFVVEVAALPQPDPETLGAVAAAHGIDILGPPGTLP
jgi:quercetin dioxygenase-like cupin family protein